VTPVFAGQIHFNVNFNLGSLIASGSVAGIGNTDVLSTLNASGIPQVICKNQGGNQAPGQNPPRVSATGSDFLPGTDTTRKNGKAPYADEATWNNNVVLLAPGSQWGCPNDNWTAYVGPFIFWDSATLTFSNATSGEILASQNYSCVTTAATKSKPASVSCTPVP
jgi:hypothetical protein